jgi:glycosyltransferase involved in cell wall biosynthesis
VNQTLFCELGRLRPDLEITLLVPSNWRNEYTRRPWRVETHPGFTGSLVTLPVILAWHISLHAYRYGLGRLLRRVDPDYIYLDEEPWAAVTQQVARLRHRARPFLFHTNQNLQKRYPPPFGAFERWIYRQASHALPVGEEAAQVLRAKGYRGPLTVFPYGIDEAFHRRQPEAARIVRQRAGAEAERFVFGYLGRFVEEKGLRGLVQAFARVARAHPRATLWLVGSGAETEALRALAASLGLGPPHFCILNSVPHEDAPTVLSAMDALVLPSLTRPFWKEQFGRVLIEALACDTPVIGSDSGEIPHLLRKLGGGLVVPEGDEAAWAAAMESLVSDPARARALAATGRARVLAEYTNRHLADVFAKILESLDSGPPRQG